MAKLVQGEQGGSTPDVRGRCLEVGVVGDFSFDLDAAFIEGCASSLDQSKLFLDFGSVLSVFLNGYGIHLVFIDGLKQRGTLVEAVLVGFRVGEVARVETSKTKAIFWLDFWVVSMMCDST